MWNPTEYPVPSRLRRHVAGLWSHVTPDGGLPPVRLLPDGQTDLLVRFDSFGAGGPPEPSAVVVVGPTVRHQLVDSPPRTAFLGVRLRPEAAESVLRVSPAELVGATVPVADCARHLDALAGRLAGSGPFPAAMTRLTEVLCEVVSTAEEIPSCVRDAVGRLGGPASGESVAGVARRVGLTARTLHRRVLRATGLPPKVLARIFRFRRAVAVMRAGGAVSLCRLAADCGYADQSHLCREFRLFAGVSPLGLAAP